MKAVSYKMIHRIAVIYAVGLVGFSIPFTHGVFIKLTPLLLVFSFVFLLYYSRDLRRKNRFKILYFYSFVFIAGFLVEMWGVNTGMLFGNYLYGSGLGPKIGGAPPIIGLNWVLMIYMTSAIFSPLKRNVFNGVVWPSLLMMGYDIILEQVAPTIDMWSWKNDLIPMQNYMMWFILALFFHSVRYALRLRDRNPMALPLFLIQTVFFLLLMLIN